MGITVHWMDKHNFEMHMACLAVIRIKGSHTGVNILEHFDNVMLKFNIKCKAVRIVSAGAANMRKAFELQLEVPADESEVLEVVEQREVCAAAKECIDSDEEMEDAAGSTAPDTESSLDTATFLEMEQLEEELSAKVAAMFLSSDHYKRVGCFNHAPIMLLGMGLRLQGLASEMCWPKSNFGWFCCTSPASFLTVWRKLLEESCLWTKLSKPVGIQLLKKQIVS